jgi:hypothetical protein
VTWRETVDACGWAPLFPGAGFIPGRGWLFRGQSVGADHSFDLSASAFTFVPLRSFRAPRVPEHRLSGAGNSAIFEQSKVSDFFFLGANRRVVNRGIDPRRVEQAGRIQLQQISLFQLQTGLKPLIDTELQGRSMPQPCPSARRGRR